MISDDFQSLITRLSVLMLFALSLLYIEYSIHSSYKKFFIFPERNILFFCHSVHTSKGSSRRSEKIIKSWWWWGPLLLLSRLPLTRLRSGLASVGQSRNSLSYLKPILCSFLHSCPHTRFNPNWTKNTKVGFGWLVQSVKKWVYSFQTHCMLILAQY